MKQRKKQGARHWTESEGRAGPLPAPGVPAPGVAWRKWLYRLTAAVTAPILLFALVELGLRMFGFGSPMTFFISSPVAGQNMLVENRKFSRTYFPRPLMRIPRSLAFSEAKSAQTLRVFVFGESAAEGDPDPAFGFARILQVLLRERYPGTDIELINTAVTAINSHVIRPIARECSHLSGDVWVVYMGNNEVVGPFGAGTVFGTRGPNLAFIRASIAVKNTRTGQLLHDTLDRLTSRGPQSWTGMEMFLNQQLREDDPRMAGVYSHFRQNLSDIVSFGICSGAKVVVSTVASNLRDCAPFASLHRADMQGARLAQWEAYYQAGIGFENTGKPAKAVAQYQLAAELDGGFADLQFRLGRCEEALGRREEAARCFVRARDLDTLRFRADSRLNDIIRAVASEWHSRGARIADIEKALAGESADGISGQEWFYEHIHLTFPGNYLIARRVAEQVTQALEAAEHAFRVTRPRPDEFPVLGSNLQRGVGAQRRRLAIARKRRRRRTGAWGQNAGDWAFTSRD